MADKPAPRSRERLAEVIASFADVREELLTLAVDAQKEGRKDLVEKAMRAGVHVSDAMLSFRDVYGVIGVRPT